MLKFFSSMAESLIHASLVISVRPKQAQHNQCFLHQVVRLQRNQGWSCSSCQIATTLKLELLKLNDGTVVVWLQLVQKLLSNATAQPSTNLLLR